jgi:hypothetical protein
VCTIATPAAIEAEAFILKGAVKRSNRESINPDQSVECGPPAKHRHRILWKRLRAGAVYSCLYSLKFRAACTRAARRLDIQRCFARRILGSIVSMQ